MSWIIPHFFRQSPASPKPGRRAQHLCAGPLHHIWTATVRPSRQPKAPIDDNEVGKMIAEGLPGGWLDATLPPAVSRGRTIEARHRENQQLGLFSHGGDRFNAGTLIILIYFELNWLIPLPGLSDWPGSDCLIELSHSRRAEPHAPVLSAALSNTRHHIGTEAGPHLGHRSGHFGQTHSGRYAKKTKKKNTPPPSPPNDFVTLREIYRPSAPRRASSPRPRSGVPIARAVPFFFATFFGDGADRSAALADGSAVPDPDGCLFLPFRKTNTTTSRPAAPAPASGSTNLPCPPFAPASSSSRGAGGGPNTPHIRKGSSEARAVGKNR